MDAYTATARRLRLAADIFEARAHHCTRAVLDLVTAGFRSAASAFEDIAPGAPYDLPEALTDAIDALTAVFQAHDFGLSPALVEYAVAPAAEETPRLRALGAVNAELAWEDFELRCRQRVLANGGALDSLDDETVSWALRSLATVHYQHEVLADRIAVDNATPDNRGREAFRPIPGARTAPDHHAA